MMRIPTSGRHGPSMFAMLLTPATSAVAAPVRVGDFATEGDALPAPWQVVPLDQRVPATRYRALHWEGRAAMNACATSPAPPV